MKKFINRNTGAKSAMVVFALALLVISTSCEVTDLQPRNSFSDVTAFDTPARIELAMAGVYDAAQNGDYLGQVQRLSFWCSTHRARRYEGRRYAEPGIVLCGYL